MAKITGINNLKKLLKDLKKNGKVAAQKGILKTAKLIEADAKAKVPVKMGILQSSIGIEQTPEVTYIYAAAKHAAYQEFGTGPLTVVPKGYEPYAMEFFVNGLGNTKPQPFLFPAFFRHQASVEKNVEEELQNLADEFNRS